VIVIADTHALLWFLAGDSKLSERARETLADPANDARVSVASLWEIAIKYSIEKLALSEGVEGILHAAFAQSGFERLEILPEHLIEVSTLPFVEHRGHRHGDPFDRLLVAQGRVEGATIISTETWWKEAYGVEMAW
jgi:PIN domain nuclease of toxin-antitoxin system